MPDAGFAPVSAAAGGTDSGWKRPELAEHGDQPEIFRAVAQGLQLRIIADGVALGLQGSDALLEAHMVDAPTR